MERYGILFFGVPVSILFTVIGIYAWTRKKPMWFWAGSEILETEISDIPAYNRANGIMWIVFSLVFWFSTIIGMWNGNVGEIIMEVGVLIGFPALVIAWKRIYKKYSV